jgi:hypothetical protein
MFSTRETMLTIPPPPRIIRAKPGAHTLVRAMRLFIIPHTLVGLFIMFSIPAQLYVAHFGTPVTAVVEKLSATPSRKGGTVYEISFYYDLDGRRFEERASASAEVYDQLHLRDRFQGRASSLLSHSLFVGPAWQHEPLWQTVLFAVIWNAILCPFLYMFWIRPLHERWLARNGLAAPGTITGKKQTTGRGGYNRLYFTFHTAESQTINSKFDVAPADFHSATEGDPVTVLYNPRHPRRCIPFEYSDFTIA